MMTAEREAENRAGDQLSLLMRRAQEGHSDAYAILLAEIVPLLRREVRRRRRMLPPQDIEDLVQDVLLSLHAVRATYDPGRPFLPWLMAIAHNRIIDGARRQIRRNANEVLVDELPETFADEATNRQIEAYGDAEALRHAMQQLPPGQRLALEMVKLREMSLKEAAASTGMSVAALKIAVHRGIGALRKVLNAGTRP
jgi:RNA polymerase sigma-70 factor (ECF subfamily)